MHKKVFLFLVLGSLAACDSTSIGNLPIDSLEFYIESAKDGGLSKGEDVLAFAAGGNTLVSDVPVSIYFHPAKNSTGPAVWETSDPNADADDYLKYRQTNADIRDLFQGTLKRFLSPDPSDRWVIVTYLTDGAYHLSKPIRIEAEARPTESSLDRASVTISNGVPTLSWQDGIYPDNMMYVAILSSIKGSVSAAVTTEQQSYRYGDGASIISLLEPEGGVPALQGDTEYIFTLMGLSENRWMQLYSLVQFTIP